MSGKGLTISFFYLLQIKALVCSPTRDKDVSPELWEQAVKDVVHGVEGKKLAIR